MNELIAVLVIALLALILSIISLLRGNTPVPPPVHPLDSLPSAV